MLQVRERIEFRRRRALIKVVFDRPLGIWIRKITLDFRCCSIRVKTRNLYHHGRSSLSFNSEGIAMNSISNPFGFPRLYLSAAARPKLPKARVESPAGGL